MLQPAAQKPTHSKQQNRQEIIALCGAFFILGMAFATWASRIPAIRDSALLIPATLGYVLLARGTGTVTMMPVTAWFINQIGAKKTAIATGGIMVMALVPMTLAGDWLVLSAVMLLTGASGGGFNLAINAIASNVEKRSGRSRMSTLHSWFGVGNLGGALIGTAAAAYKVSAVTHFSGITILLAVVLAGAFSFIRDEGPDEEAKAAGFKWPHGGLIWLGVIVFMAATIEASVTNWIALFFTDHVGAGEGLAPAGYAAYAGSMLLMRFVGDRLKPKFGPRKLIATGSFVAASGMILAIIAPNVALATLGAFIIGAGVALTFPMIFSAAGKEGAMALASVVMFGSIGEMVSQPVMGLVVEQFQLSGGFVFIAIVSCSVAALAWRAKLLKEGT